MLFSPLVFLYSEYEPNATFPLFFESITLAPLEKLASVVSLMVEIAELLVLIFDVFVEMLEVLFVMLDKFAAISESFEEMLVVLVLMLNSTSDMLPNVRVPSISASLRIVTVPEV